MVVAEYFLGAWKAVTYKPLFQRQVQAVLSAKDTAQIHNIYTEYMQTTSVASQPPHCL